MTSRSKKTNNNQQSLFANTEQFLCKCGCGMYGFRKATGRKREYINDTHKKRVMRAKRKAKQTDTHILLTAKGIAKARELAGANMDYLWDVVTSDEQWVLHLAAQHPSGVEAFWMACSVLMRRETERYVTEGDYDDAHGH